MKFTKDKANDVMHVYARGKGPHTEIILRYIEMDTYRPINFVCNLDLEECKALIEYLQAAQQDFERRKELKDDDDS